MNNSTSLLGSDHIPRTTSATIIPPVTSTLQEACAVQSFSTTADSNATDGGIASHSHLVSAGMSQQQPAKMQTYHVSSRRTLPVEVDSTHIRSTDHNQGTQVDSPTDRAQHANLGEKPQYNIITEQTGDGVETANQVCLEKQRLNATDPSYVQPIIIKDKICKPATTRGIIDASEHQAASNLIEISSSVEASSGEGFELTQKQLNIEWKNEQVIGKRKSESTTDTVVKRLRGSSILEYSKLQPIAAKPAVQLTGSDGIEVEATDDHIQRKTIIIGFNSNGPRNQGIPSSCKPLAGMQAPAPEAPMLRNVQSSLKKRKHAEAQQPSDYSVGPQRVIDAPTKKFRKTVTVVPPTPRNAEKPRVQLSSPLAQPASPQRSQISKAKATDSPTAMRDHARRISHYDTWFVKDHMTNNRNDAVSMDIDRDRGVGNNTDCDHSLAQDMKSPRIQCSTFQQQLQSKPKDIERPTSRIGKKLPGSSHVPSYMSADNAKNYEQTINRLVNVRKVGIVQVAKISDPFGGQDKNHTSLFIDKLRAIGGVGRGTEKPKAEEIHFTLHGKGSECIQLIDPDQTLVETQHGLYRSTTPSNNGYSSSSSSPESNVRNNHSQHPDIDTEERRMNDEREWRQGLKSHQTRPLDSLCTMSNVSGNSILSQHN